MASPPRLALIILAVSDLPRALAFYRACFDWPQIVDTPVYAEFDLPAQQRLGLYVRDAFRRNVGDRAPVAPGADELTATELYFYADDVAATIQRLERAGARLLSGLQTRAWLDEAAYYADPDGNVLVVARPGTAN